MVEASIVIRETIDGYNRYNRYLNIIAANVDGNNVCKLSKKRLSELFGLSYTGTQKRIKFFIRYGLVKQVAGGFVLTGKDAIQDTPIALLPKIMNLIFSNPDLYNSYKGQAEILSVSIHDVQTAWGYYSNFFGAKCPDTKVLDIQNKNGILWKE